LDVLLDAGNPIKTLASSIDSADPRERAGAAVDGDLHTGWVAKAGDRSPTVALKFTSRHTVDGVTVLPIQGAPTSAPTNVLVHAGGAVFRGSLDDGGVLPFPHPVRTDAVTVTVLSSTLRVSTDSVTGTARQLPVGIGEIRLRGPGAPVGQAAARVSVGCDQVSPVALDGARVPMRVQASAVDVLAGRTVRAEPCGPAAINLGNGAHDVRLAASALLAPDSLTFTRSGEAAAEEVLGSAGTLDMRTWSATDRSVRVTATQAALFIVRENANAGWRATLGGTTLAPITVDGWEQGWLVPAGANGVIHLQFRPQRSVDIGLVAGGLAVGVLICGALISGRGRRSTSGALSDATAPGVVIVAAAVLALGAIGGWAGAIVGIVALVVSRQIRKHMRVPAGLAGAALLAAGLASASSAGSAHPVAESRGAQLACLIALALLIVARPYRTPPRAAEAAQQRAFDEVPRDGGDGGGGEGGKDE
jgi:arabinofuranan 3-O-arabinosyltransferase